jgi:tetratricopeptide (TPR) repeat protein
MADRRYSEAQEVLHQALEVDQKQIPIYTNLAEVALHLGYSGEIVLDYLNKAFALNARQPANKRDTLFGARLMKAWALSRLGRHDEASELVTAVFDEAPQDFVPLMGELHYLSGLMAMEQGKADTARAAFHKSLRIDPEGMYGKLAKTMLEQ